MIFFCKPLLVRGFVRGLLIPALLQSGDLEPHFCDNRPRKEEKKKYTSRAEGSHQCVLPLFLYVLPLVVGLDWAQRVEARDAAYVGFFKKEHLHEA